MEPGSTHWFVVSDEPHPCPYLPGRIAVLPLRFPLMRPRGPAFDRLLAEGDRRAGSFFYRTACDACHACEPLRVPITRFSPTKSQRRVWRRNEGVIEVELGPALATERHVEIYNAHKLERGLSAGEGAIDLATYRQYYVESGVETCEVRYRIGGRLVAFSVCDLGVDSVSSVYHAFDPAESGRSLGTYSVLKEIELFGSRGYAWYYLGLWVGACPSLAYKARFFPHERRRDGQWHEHREPEPGAPSGP